MLRGTRAAARSRRFLNWAKHVVFSFLLLKNPNLGAAAFLKPGIAVLRYCGRIGGPIPGRPGVLRKKVPRRHTEH